MTNLCFYIFYWEIAYRLPRCLQKEENPKLRSSVHHGTAVVAATLSSPSSTDEEDERVMFYSKQMDKNIIVDIKEWQFGEMYFKCMLINSNQN